LTTIHFGVAAPVLKQNKTRTETRQSTKRERTVNVEKEIDQKGAHLPIRQKDDRLDDDKLWERLVRPQQVVAGEVEQQEDVERQRVADGVDESQVQVRPPRSKVALVVEALGVENEGGGC
jgi:hypothetical protein